MAIRIGEDARSSRPGRPVESKLPAPADRHPIRERLNAGCITDQTRGLDETLRRHIIGQDAAIGALTCSFSRVLSGMRDPDRPALTLLLLGPTGVGKTETARVLADAIFGSRHALTQINCEEYAQGHEVSKQRVFEKFVSELHVRALKQAGVPMLIRISPQARDAIIARGTDLTLGARPLSRAVEAELVDPLSRLIAAHQIAPGDVIEVEREGDELGFYRTRAETTVVLP